MIELIINPLQKLDVDEAYDIASDAYGSHHWSKDSFYSEIDNNIAKYYIARFKTGEAAGFAGIWHIVDEVHITTVAVKKIYQRRHAAETLLVKMIEDCYNNFVKYITLEVRVSNIPAIELYKKYGFRSLGVRKGYYQDNNEDALIMWTENIFSDEYKTLFSRNRNNLKETVSMK